MKKVKGIGQWSGKNVPGMYQKGGTTKVTPENLDSIKEAFVNKHKDNIIVPGNNHLIPDSIKGKFDGKKMPFLPDSIKEKFDKFIKNKKRKRK